MVPNLFEIEYHLEFLYSRRVPPGSRETQVDQISVYSQVEHANEPTTITLLNLCAEKIMGIKMDGKCRISDEI